MRLWHYKLLGHLSTQRLLGQHREVCALRGLGWGKKHSVVNYVFKHSYYKLYLYHMKLIFILTKRKTKKGHKIKVDDKWLDPRYRGKSVGYDMSDFTDKKITSHVYCEHDERYLKECLENLRQKNEIINLF